MSDDLEILALAAICAVAFALRLIPLIRKRWFGNDSHYHLLVNRAWRKDGRYPKIDPNLLPSNMNTYPPLLQVLIYPCASISERAAMMIVSPTVDIITIILLYVIGVWADISQPLIAPLIYAASANNLLDAGTLNPRPLGNMLIVAVVFALIDFADTGDVWVYVLLVFFEALVMLSHKLSVQVLIPLLVYLSLLVFSLPHHSIRGWPILASPALAVLMATLLTGGAYIRKILPDHIRYIGVHLRHGDYRTGKRRIPSPINLLKSNPIAYIAPFLGLYTFVFVEEGRDDLFLPWSWIVLVLAQLWIWGDSWRYLQLGTFPGAMVFARFITLYGFSSNIQLVLTILLLAGLAVVAYIQVKAALDRDNAQKVADALERMPRDWLNEIKGKKVFSNVQHYIVPYITNSSVLLGVRARTG
jgi:hypothetical protein